MEDHGSYYGSYALWVVVIVIIIILIVACFAYFYGGFGQNNGVLFVAGADGPRRAAKAKKVTFPPESVVASVHLSGDQEVPPVRTCGKGKGTVLINSETKEVEYDIYVKKLSSEIDLDVGVHFHRGERGENGPVLKNLNIEKSDSKYRFRGTWSPSDASQPLTQKDLDDLLSGRVYVNVHTLKYADGEVRGQVDC